MPIVRRILVLQTAFLGDVLLGATFFYKIRELYPEAEVSIICRPNTGTILKNLGLVDVVIEINKGQRSSYRMALKALKNFPIDVLFVMHRSVRSYLLSLQIVAKIKIAYRLRWNSFGFTHLVVRDLHLPEPLRQLQLLLPLLEKSAPEKAASLLNEMHSRNWNQKINELVLPTPPVSWRPPLRQMIAKFADEIPTLAKSSLAALPAESRRIAVFPGSVWPTKRWTESGFAGLIKELVKRGWKILLMGAPDERALCERVAEQAGEPDQVLVLAGALTPWESLLTLAGVERVVTNDSASAHMAALLDLPIVAIFGPTTLALGYRPWATEVKIVENNALECRPCGKHGHKRCPLGHHLCMKNLSSVAVLQACGLPNEDAP